MTPSPKDVVAAVPKSGTPEKSSAPPPTAPAGGDARAAAPRAPGRQASARRLLAAAAAVLAVALLFLAYLQVSRTYPENSDESNDLLMAWDMLHGNVLLHGWYLSDVSFITTELPQYALLVWLFGLHADTAHIAAAMTYTLVVILLLLSLGHIGTAVPLLLTWLLVDRCPPRRWVPVLVGLLLTWVLIADSLVLLVGVVPLVAVCALRVSRDLARRQDTSGQAVLRARWYELSLAAAAIAAQGLASLAGRLLQAYIHPLAYQFAPVHTWPGHAWVTGKGLLALFGAKPEGPPAAMAFALLHLAGVALVAWAVLRVARRFLSWPDMISQILLVAMVLNVVAYVPSTLASATDLNAREFAVVLPFGAVLAGRTLAASLQAGLGYAAAQPSVPPMNARLARFLAAHHLTSGIGGYWLSSVVTVGSDGAVTIRAVASLPLAPYPWEAKSSWYDPGHNQANFLVTGGHPGFFNNWQPKPAALAALGRPVRTYRTGPYTVYVYDKNLLAELSHQ